MGVAPATGSNALPDRANGGPSQTSAAPSIYFARGLSGHCSSFDDENLNSDVALRRKVKEETKRRKAGEGAAKEEKRSTGDDRRSMEAVGRERERESEPVMNEHKKYDRRNRVGTMIIGADGGANASLHLRKTDVGWKSGNAASVKESSYRGPISLYGKWSSEGDQPCKEEVIVRARQREILEPMNRDIAMSSSS